jgi:hypothetical protein
MSSSRSIGAICARLDGFTRRQTVLRANGIETLVLGGMSEPA